MTYPVNLLRGIFNDSYLLEDGSIATHLFYFDDKHCRGDGWIEQSITWEDDSLSLTLLLEQTKDGKLQFEAGAVRVPCEEIDRLSRQPTIIGLLSYERQPIDTNRYHGNLLLRSSVCKPTMRKIAAGIALAVSDVIRQTCVFDKLKGNHWAAL